MRDRRVGNFPFYKVRYVTFVLGAEFACKIGNSVSSPHLHDSHVTGHVSIYVYALARTNGSNLITFITIFLKTNLGH